MKYTLNPYHPATETVRAELLAAGVPESAIVLDGVPFLLDYIDHGFIKSERKAKRIATDCARWERQADPARRRIGGRKVGGFRMPDVPNAIYPIGGKWPGSA